MHSVSNHRVACGLLTHADRVLLVHRSPSKEWCPSVWDFPGGHLESGESSRRAVVRELREELGIDVALPPISARHSVRTTVARIDIWRVLRWDGDVENAAPDEHDAIGWFTADEVRVLDLADPAYSALIDRVLA